MLLITRQMDYGLLLMATLALNYGHGVISLREIAKKRRLPYSFLVKIALSLRSAGFLRAKEGALGGYSLSRPPNEITIREVLEAVSERISFVRCECASSDCQSFCFCGTRLFWHELQTKLNSVLGETTVADLISSPTTSAKLNVSFGRLATHI